MVAALLTLPTGGLSQRRAQEPDERRAVVTASGHLDQGSCTIELLLAGSAEIEIHGDRAVLRGPSTQTAQWRRFVCDGILPKNPIEFHFSHAAGRGRQQLIRDPRLDGGVPAVAATETH